MLNKIHNNKFSLHSVLNSPRPLFQTCIGLLKQLNYCIITTTYMNIEPTSTVRARRLRERRSRGVVMIAPVEVGEGGIALLVSKDLLKEHQTADRGAVGEACLAALEAWAAGRGARTLGR